MKVGFISNRPSTFKTCQWVLMLGKAPHLNDEGNPFQEFNRKVWIAENGIGLPYGLSTHVVEEGWPEHLGPELKNWSMGNKPMLRHMLAPGGGIAEVTHSSYKSEEVSLDSFDCFIDINAGKFIIYTNNLQAMSDQQFCDLLKEKAQFQLPRSVVETWRSFPDGTLKILDILIGAGFGAFYKTTKDAINWAKVEEQFHEVAASKINLGLASKMPITKWILRGGKVSFTPPPKEVEPPPPEVKPYQETFASDTYNIPYDTAMQLMEDKLKFKLAQEKAAMEVLKVAMPKHVNLSKNPFTAPPKPKKKAQWTNPVYYKVE